MAEGGKRGGEEWKVERGRRKGEEEEEEEERDRLRAEIADEHGRRFGYGRDGVFLDDGVGRQDAFGEALDHGAWEAEVLRGGRFGAVSGLCVDAGCGACVGGGGGASGWARRDESVCGGDGEGVFLCVSDFWGEN